MTEIIKEFVTKDGLGAMLWKKIYAMSYAYRHKMLFQNTPFDWFLIHEADKISTTEQYETTIKQFNGLLFNPWADIDFNSIPDAVLSKRIGAGLGHTQYGPGFIDVNDFLREAPVFNKITNDNSNNIVIHLRRGNATPENPRYTGDEFYLNLLSQINKIVGRFDLKAPEIIICTDAPDEPKMFKPDDNISKNNQVTGSESGLGQNWMWNQPYLNANENGEYPVISANFDEYRKVCPPLKVYNKLSSYDSMLLMLRAKVLITANSSFSQSAGLLSHNRVIGLSPSPGINRVYNKYRNQVGILSPNGDVNF